MGPESGHQPVLVEEVLRYLITVRTGVYADLTVGGGGHAAAVLEALDAAGTIVGLDRDPDAVAIATARLARFGSRVVLEAGRAGDLTAILAVRGIEQVDGVLLDLGISSLQLNAGRGFSFEGDAPLDLRFDPGEGREPASALLARLDARDLAGLLGRHGELRPAVARRLARRLIEVRRRRPLDSVAAVREALVPVIPPPHRARTLARVFQTLRIEVNDELAEVDRGLEAAARALRPGGVVCIISYHSLEDRRVKAFLRPPAPPRRHLPPPPGWPSPRFRSLTPGAVRPGAREVLANPRSRSARLRAGERRVDESV